MTEPQNVSGLMDQIHDLKTQLADAERRANERKWECDNLHIGVYTWDEAVAELEERGLPGAIEALAQQRDAAEKRGAVKALREQAERAERDYLEFMNALQGCRGDADYWRWNGHAEALRAVATRLRKLAGDEVPAYGSQEWREQHSVRAQAGTP